MREFLPFKSYRLLDAAWLMCCGEPRQGMVSTTGESMARNIATQMLRGPEEQEYELRLSTSRGEGGRVLVRFTLGGSTGEAGSSTAAASAAASIRTAQRKIEDLQDRAQLLQIQIAEARRKVEVGIAAGGDIPKLEVELRSIQREIRDLEQRIASNTVTRSMQRGGGSTTSERSIRSSIIDTSFSMDVGETVVVGTSRLKGGDQGADRAADRRAAADGGTIDRSRQCTIAGWRSARRNAQVDPQAGEVSRRDAEDHAGARDAAPERRHRAALHATPTSCWSRRSSRRSAPTSASTRSRRRSSSAIPNARGAGAGDHRASSSRRSQSTGFFRAKSRSLLGMATEVVEHHGGEIPRDDGRAGEAARRRPQDRERRARPRARRARACPSIATCCASRTGSASRSPTIPEIVEQQLCAAMPPAEWTRTSDTLILHGRRICKPRPLCDQLRGPRRLRLTTATADRARPSRGRIRGRAAARVATEAPQPARSAASDP